MAMLRRTGILNPIEVRCPDCVKPVRGEDGRFLSALEVEPCLSCAGTQKVYSTFEMSPPSDAEIRRAERLGQAMICAGWSQAKIESGGDLDEVNHLLKGVA